MANARIGSHPSHGYQVVETVDTTKQLDRNDSGKLFMLNNSSSFTINLPKLSTEIAGWHCKFILSVDGSNAVYIMAHGLTSAGGAVAVSEDAETVRYREIPGHTDAGSNEVDDDGINIHANSIIGDTWEIMTDGSYWYITAQIHNADHSATVDAD